MSQVLHKYTLESFQVLQCICMVKKIKIKKKTTLEKVSNLSLRLKVLVYIANVCQIVVLKSVM